MIDGGSSRCSISPYNFSGGANDPGVTCGQQYGPFTVGASNVTLARSRDAGRNGTIVINGGRTTPLPNCMQTSYSAANGASYGIDLGSRTGVVIDGQDRSGIIVRGARNGVRMGPGGTDMLRNMELFDNGYAVSHSWGYSTDGNNILTGGRNNGYDRLLIHDAGQDEFHSDSSGYDHSGSRVTNTWMGAMREHPSYGGEPFNDLQKTGADPGCTHADGFQSFAPATTMSGLTFDHDVFGPGINQGLYPGDSGTGTRFNNVSVTNTLFLDAASHNIINDLPVHGWTIDNVTIFATQGGFELPSDGTNTITNVIKQGGYVDTPGGTWTTSGNDWWRDDPLPGQSSNMNPNFSWAPTGTLPGLTALRAANFMPGGLPSGGSPIHSWSELLSRIDSLNGS
jgi:hypothetical protein